MNYRIKNKRLLILTAAAVAAAALWYTGIFGLLFNGISYIANDTKTYTQENSQIVPGQYELTVNLADLDSNIGKELYNDGSNRIYVSWIDNTRQVSTGGYRIGFRSCGEYSLNGAVLISGIAHKAVDNQSFTSDMSAKMTGVYNGKTYNCGVYGTSGLNYKDGDDFAFYLFPGDAYNNGEITLEEKGDIRLTVTKLYKNVWTKNK